MALYGRDFVNQAKECLKEYVETITLRAPHSGKNAYVCPCCHSGEGPNHTAAFNIYRDKNENMRFKCYSCGVSGDIFELFGLMNGTRDFREQKRLVADFLHADSDYKIPLGTIKYDASVQSLASEEEIERAEKFARKHIEEAEKHVDETDYFQKRGFNDETIKYFHLGYNSRYRQAVIPFTKSYYIGRNVNIGQDAKGQNKHYKPKFLNQPLFNIGALSNKNHDPVFIVEAPMDAMSIIQSGGQAIALGGHSTNVLFKTLSVYQPDIFFILALDSDKPGRDAQDHLIELFEEKQISFTTVNHRCFADYKDANEALVKNPDLLQEAVDFEIARARLSQAPFEHRAYLASSPETSDVILDALAFDSSWQVRDFLAANPSAPYSALEILSHDADCRIRENVSNNPVWEGAAVDCNSYVERRVGEIIGDPVYIDAHKRREDLGIETDFTSR